MTGSKKDFEDPRTPGSLNSRSTRRKGRALRPAPPASVLMRLHRLVERSRRTSVPLPTAFVRDETAEEGPPLARILRGGRGGEVRLKLLLSMHVLGVRPPHNVPGLPSSWAQTLDLPEPLANGARRVRDAMAWLAEHEFIRVEKERGRPPECFLLSPLGTGDDYMRPTPTPRYIRVPVAMWQNGWIITLSGTALALWLVLADMQGGREDRNVWVQPDQARERYGLSEDTFTKGISELERHGLVRVSKQPQGDDEWYYNRLRNAYLLYGGRLNDAPHSPVTASSTAPLSAAFPTGRRRSRRRRR